MAAADAGGPPPGGGAAPQAGNKPLCEVCGKGTGERGARLLKCVGWQTLALAQQYLTAAVQHSKLDLTGEDLPEDVPRTQKAAIKLLSGSEECGRYQHVTCHTCSFGLSRQRTNTLITLRNWREDDGGQPDGRHGRHGFFAKLPCAFNRSWYQFLA